MAAGNSAICDIAGGHRSCEKIACTTCQMSNVCCAMFNVVVKAPDDLLTKPPILNGNDLVIRSFRQWVVLQVHRTSHNRHSTFDKFWTPFIFFAVDLSSGWGETRRALWKILVPADEVQNSTVENFRLFPVGRMPAVLKYDSLRCRYPGRDHPHQCRRQGRVGIRGRYQDRYADSLSDGCQKQIVFSGFRRSP